jgi:hypothetical protein
MENKIDELEELFLTRAKYSGILNDLTNDFNPFKIFVQGWHDGQIMNVEIKVGDAIIKHLWSLIKNEIGDMKIGTDDEIKKIIEKK